MYERRFLHAPPERVSATLVDPKTDLNFQEGLTAIGYQIKIIYLNNEQPDPARRGPAIGYSIWKIGDEVTHPGYEEDPAIMEWLEKQSFERGEVVSEPVQTFALGSQHSGAVGTIKIFPEMGLLATSNPQMNLQVLGKAILTSVYGSDWKKDREKIGTVGVSIRTAQNVISEKFLKRAPQYSKIPRLTLHRWGQTVYYIPPNIVLDYDYKQMKIEDSGRSKPYEVQEISDLISDVLDRNK